MLRDIAINHRIQLLSIVGLSLSGTPAFADIPTTTTVLSPEDVAKRFELLEPDDVSSSPIPWLYQIDVGRSDIAYISKDGRFLVRGDIVEIESGRNITQEGRIAARASHLAQVSDDQAIILSPKNPRYELNVFIDVDCPYCRAFHEGVAELVDSGVKIRYFLYPQHGPQSLGWDRALAVWCAPDRKQALTRMLEEPYDGELCNSNAVSEHYALGNGLGLEITPMLLTSTGHHLGGLLTPREVIERLTELEGK